MTFQKVSIVATVLWTVLLAPPFSLSAASDPEVDAWFARHTEKDWEPTVKLWEAKRAEMTTPVEKLILPLEYWPSGSIKARLFAERAQILDLGSFVFAEGVRVELLAEDGTSDGLLNASDCVFDRKAKKGFCKGEVSVIKGGDRIKGRGMFFSIDDRFIKILSQCEIRTGRFAGTFGRLK